MSDRGLTKEILAELGVLGVSVPRCLLIPLVSTQSETDLLNVQMTVMDMLADDHEISKLVSNSWSLGVDIKAFNVQKQCWDLLDLDNDLELPHRASIQVIITDNEQGQPDSRRRDPRRDESRSQQGLLSRRDPRRKLREDVELENKEELPRVAASLPTPTEPDPSKLSRNDPRRRKLLEKNQSDSERILPKPPTTSSSSLGSLRPLPTSKTPDDSDSDEGNLQIDEGFDENNSRKTSINKNMITESQLSVEEIEKVDYTEDVGDRALWDEIYGISGSSDSPYTIFDPKLDKKAKNSSVQDDVIFEKEDSPQGLFGEKSIEQLTREKELLMSLVAERDKMNNLVASHSQAPEEIILEDEIEDGEISDSSDECEEVKDKDSDVEIMTPASPEEPSTGISEFVSPASPTAIQLDLENEEIDIIPLEREDKTVEKSNVKSPGQSEVKIVSSSVPAEKYKKSWDQIPVEDKLKKISESDQFSAARAKLSKYKNLTQNKNNRGRPFDPPRAAPELQPVEAVRARPRPSRDQPPHVPPKELFLKAAQRSGISPFSSNNSTLTSSSSTFTDQKDPGHQAGPRFSPPNRSHRKGVALLNKPNFPPPVKVTDVPPVNSFRPTGGPSPMFNSAVRSQQSSNFSFPPPPPPIFQIPPVSQPVSYQSNNQRMEFSNEREPAASNVWMTGWRQRESNTSDNRRTDDNQHSSHERNPRDGRRRNRSGGRDQEGSQDWGQDRRQERRPDWDLDWDQRRQEGRYQSRSPIRSEGVESARRHDRSRSGEQSEPASRERERVNAMKDTENAFLCFYEGEDCLEADEGEPGPAVPSSLNNKHPVSAVYEYKGRMNYPPPKFKEVWGPGGTWAFTVSLGPHTFTCPRFRNKKKDAKAEACRYALQMLGAWN